MPETPADTLVIDACRPTGPAGVHGPGRALPGSACALYSMRCCDLLLVMKQMVFTCLVIYLVILALGEHWTV